MPDYDAFFNGKWLPHSEVSISPSDRGFSVGDLVFEVERTFNGVPFQLTEHIDRLYRSLTYVRMDAVMTASEMTELVVEGVTRASHDLANVGEFGTRQVVTRGTVDLFDDGVDDQRLAAGTAGQQIGIGARNAVE